MRILSQTDRVPASTNATLAACGVPPGDQSATIVGIPASFGSLAILLVLIRIFGRLWITKVDLDWDDYLIVLAVVSLVRNGVSCCHVEPHTELLDRYLPRYSILSAILVSQLSVAALTSG